MICKYRYFETNFNFLRSNYIFTNILYIEAKRSWALLLRVEFQVLFLVKKYNL